MEHFIGLFPLPCELWCWAKEVSNEKPILHTPHTKGFCSTCTHWCSKRSVAWLKIFMHCVHWKDLSWVTIHWCSWGLARWDMSWPQAPHLCPLSPPTCSEGCWAWTACCWPCWGCCREVSGCRTTPYTAQPRGLSVPWGSVCTTEGGATACCCCCHASVIFHFACKGSALGRWQGNFSPKLREWWMWFSKMEMSSLTRAQCSISVYTCPLRLGEKTCLDRRT